MTTIAELITDMKAVKADNPTLETEDVLRIFEIKALKDLISQLNRLVHKK